MKLLNSRFIRRYIIYTFIITIYTFVVPEKKVFQFKFTFSVKKYY